MAGFYYDSLMNISPLNASTTDLASAANGKMQFMTTKIAEGTDKSVAAELTVGGKNVRAPQSIFRDEMTVNCRSLKSIASPLTEENKSDEEIMSDFYTNYSDYLACMKANDEFKEFLKKRNNPTVENIIDTYNGKSNSLDPYGLASYRLQDFIFCSDYGKITNNRLITLRRYTMPTTDMMFGLGINADKINELNQYPKRHRAIATACTYINDTNKLSELLSMTFGMNWEERKSEIQTMQDPNGPMDKQFTKWFSNIPKVGDLVGKYPKAADVIARGVVDTMTGVDATEQKYNAKNRLKDLFYQNYRDQIGPQNRIDSVQWRMPGITFNHDIKLTFKYDIRSLQFVNPKTAFLDLMSNFMLLTGNYATFWGGAIHYTNSPAAPELGDKKLLASGDYGGYVKSIFKDISDNLMPKQKGGGGGSVGGKEGVAKWLALAKDFIAGSFEALMSNILGDGSDQTVGNIPKALLSGDPVGCWHLVIGNPLNPTAVIGNLILKDVSMSFNDELGKDDFPTEITFTVTLAHGMPRDIAGMQSIFNAGRGRIYIPIETNQKKKTANANGKDERYPISNALYDVLVGGRDTTGNAITEAAIKEVVKDTKKFVAP
jgi:hypothetical protein